MLHSNDFEKCARQLFWVEHSVPARVFGLGSGVMWAKVSQVIPQAECLLAASPWLSRTQCLSVVSFMSLGPPRTVSMGLLHRHSFPCSWFEKWRGLLGGESVFLREVMRRKNMFSANSDVFHLVQDEQNAGKTPKWRISVNSQQVVWMRHTTLGVHS